MIILIILELVKTFERNIQRARGGQRERDIKKEDMDEEEKERERRKE